MGGSSPPDPTLYPLLCIFLFLAIDWAETGPVQGVVDGLLCMALNSSSGDQKPLSPQGLLLCKQHTKIPIGQLGCSLTRKCETKKKPRCLRGGVRGKQEKSQERLDLRVKQATLAMETYNEMHREE